MKNYYHIFIWLHTRNQYTKYRQYTHILDQGFPFPVHAIVENYFSQYFKEE